MPLPVPQPPPPDPPSDRIIVALDLPDFASALAMVDRLEGSVRWFKVGLELYLAEGRRVVEAVRSRGFSVFLDLKLHDIPNQVASAVRSAAATGAQMLTVHAAGGPAMLAGAAEAATSLASPPKLLAVTVLTSLDEAQLHAIGVPGSPADQVLRLATMAYRAGIRGFVSSAEEVAALRSEFADATLVTPGIRPSGADPGDQKRIATPAVALAAGSDYLVVGRPITQAVDPAAAVREILREIG
jgi:orotidine-5'-phosphate decarboxylase